MDSMQDGRNSLEKIELLRVNVSLSHPDEVLDYIDEVINSSGRALIANVNIHALNLAYEQEWFRRFLDRKSVG
jgi:UDP-N-acetyl-D-mannosaminuronic acid transferase (WecB/TagA/CpsF family)